MRGKVLGAMLGACALTGVMLTSTGVAQADNTCNPQLAGHYCAVENLRPFFIAEFGANNPLVLENNSNDKYTFRDIDHQWGIFVDQRFGLCWNATQDLINGGNTVILSTCDESDSELFEMVPCPHSSWCFYNFFFGTSTGALTSFPQDGDEVFFANTGGPDADNEWQFH